MSRRGDSFSALKTMYNVIKKLNLLPYGKVRKQIYIDAEQEAALKRPYKGISEAEIFVRRLTDMLNRYRHPDAISVHGNGSERGFSV